MPIHGLDHVNIATDRLEETADFYATVLGLSKGERPAIAASGYWMCDADGQAIVHLMAHDPAAPLFAGHVPGNKTAAIHHVALRCTGFAETLARIEALGLEHRVNDRKYGDLRQVFLTDPNNINLELNFAGD